MTIDGRELSTEGINTEFLGEEMTRGLNIDGWVVEEILQIVCRV